MFTEQGKMSKSLEITIVYVAQS